MKKPIALILALLFLLPLLVCCGPSETKVVARAGKTVFTEDCFRYICMKNLTQYFGQGKQKDDLTSGELETLRNAVFTEMRRYAAIEALAEEEGIELTVPEISELQAELSRQKLVYATEQDYEEALEAFFMNDHIVDLQMRNQALEERLYGVCSQRIDAALTDEALKSDVRKYCYAASQILLISQYEEALLNGLRAKITDRESFYEYMRVYSVDVKDVRVCILGEMVEEYEKAALALDVGQISPVVLSSVGGHIILREALTDELIEERLNELREKDIVRIFRAMIDEKAATLTVDDGGDGVPELILS